MSKKHIVLFLLTAMLVSIVVFIAWPRPASAQCGSSASSCKNCHEVKKQDPVNAKGEWHTAHAFGDFCESCHGGNVKGKDAASAHTGLVDPMSDVKASCQACHPNDYMDRAKKYADALGKPLGSTSAPIAATPVAAGVTTSGGNSNCGPAAPAGGQTIDLDKVYAGIGAPPSSNIGNLILLGLIGAVVLLMLGLVLYYEHPIQRGIAAFRQLLATPAMAFTPEGVLLNVPSESVAPEIDRLLSLLASSDPATVQAITHLLADREQGPKVLKALSNMDLQALMDLGERDQKALTALLALAKELK